MIMHGHSFVSFVEYFKRGQFDRQPSLHNGTKHMLLNNFEARSKGMIYTRTGGLSHLLLKIYFGFRIDKIS